MWPAYNAIYYTSKCHLVQPNDHAAYLEEMWIPTVGCSSKTSERNSSEMTDCMCLPSIVKTVSELPPELTLKN